MNRFNTLQFNFFNGTE